MAMCNTFNQHILAVLLQSAHLGSPGVHVTKQNSSPASWLDHDLDTQDCPTLAVTDEADAPCMHLSRYKSGLHSQDCLALGVIFAATDSVAVLQVLKQDRSPLLYSLVFGEGVINDATAVALLRAVQVTPTRLLHMPA